MFVCDHFLTDVSSGCRWDFLSGATTTDPHTEYNFPPWMTSSCASLCSVPSVTLSRYFNKHTKHEAEVDNGRMLSKRLKGSCSGGPSGTSAHEALSCVLAYSISTSLLVGVEGLGGG